MVDLKKLIYFKIRNKQFIVKIFSLLLDIFIGNLVVML